MANTINATYAQHTMGRLGVKYTTAFLNNGWLLFYGMVYILLLKTGSLHNAIREISLV